MSKPLETPLHGWHVRHGGKMVEFAGWHMPVQFAGLVDEHLAVRTRAGLFDVSHMGEVRLRGAGALACVQHLTVNDATKVAVGAAQYTAMVNDDGGIIDDLLVYCLAPDDYLLVVNADTTLKDLAWIQDHAGGDVEVVNESHSWAQLALQGPLAEQVLTEVLGRDLTEIGYYRFEQAEIGGRGAIISRTGYTGEDGFEVYVHPGHAEELAEQIIHVGAPRGVLACGLGARDTLRLEAGMLLYGNDMDDTRSPVEAGLSWIVKTDQGHFIGRDALLRQKHEGTRERLTGLRIEGRGVPRHGYPVLDPAGGPLGLVTSGTFSPTLKEGIGLGYVPSASAVPGTEVAIEIRGRSFPARTVKPPFYRRERQN